VSSAVRASRRAAGKSRGHRATQSAGQHEETTMMSVRTVAILSFALLVAFEPAMLTAQSPVSYSAVTEQRLLNPEPHNWLMYRGNYSGWGYSQLEQITPANVKNLAQVWTFSTGVTEGHQAPPIVNDGVMFVTTPQQQVIALRAKSGDVL